MGKGQEKVLLEPISEAQAEHPAGPDRRNALLDLIARFRAREPDECRGSAPAGRAAEDEGEQPRRNRSQREPPCCEADQVERSPPSRRRMKRAIERFGCSATSPAVPRIAAAGTTKNRRSGRDPSLLLR